MGVCVFCRENRFINNQKNGFSVDDSLIYDDNYTYITPDISPLVPGHLLVVSQEHYNSFSSAPIQWSPCQDHEQKKVRES